MTQKRPKSGTVHTECIETWPRTDTVFFVPVRIWVVSGAVLEPVHRYVPLDVPVPVPVRDRYENLRTGWVKNDPAGPA